MTCRWFWRALLFRATCSLLLILLRDSSFRLTRRRFFFEQKPTWLLDLCRISSCRRRYEAIGGEGPTLNSSSRELLRTRGPQDTFSWKLSRTTSPKTAMFKRRRIRSFLLVCLLLSPMESTFCVELLDRTFVFHMLLTARSKRLGLRQRCSKLMLWPAKSTTEQRYASHHWFYCRKASRLLLFLYSDCVSFVSRLCEACPAADLPCPALSKK